MKKIIFLILGVVLLSSCSIRIYEPIKDSTKIESEHFQYKEHDYIYIKGKGVVHDPDCKYCLDFFD